MEVKKVKNKRLNLIVLVVVFFSLLGLVLLESKLSSKNVEAIKFDDIEIATTVISRHSISDMITNEINKVYSDSIFSIYFNSSQGIPKLYYVYKKELNYRQLTDKFFLHVYLKDEKELLKRQKNNFINLDFHDTNPIEFEKGGERYFVFDGSFSHSTLSEFLSIDKIKYFNTGRYASGKGRSQDVSKVKLEDVSPAQISNNLDKITISLGRKEFDKIKDRRSEALKSKILVKKEDDFVRSYVSYNDSEKIKAEIRLKGDWTDHLNDEKKWSFRVILDENKPIQGMTKFSIQHPKVRNYEWEWLFQQVIKREGIIGLRYNFINVDIEIKEKGSITSRPIGIMAMEESFDKKLIENNKRRESVILSFEESQIWDDRKRQFDLMLDEDARSKSLQSIMNAPIKLFEESKVLSNPKLAKQFKIAKDLIEGLRNKKLKISEVFDIDKLTMFVALTNLFGGQHGLISHNLKFYFNPITNKLEPICFDSYSGIKIKQFIDYPFSQGDDLYTQKLLEKLEIVSHQDFIKGIIGGYNDELNDIFLNLSSELKSTVDLSILDYNSNFIKKKINPSNAIVTSFLKFDKKSISVSVTNLSDFPVIINSIEHNDGKKLSKYFDKEIIIYQNEKRIVYFDLKDAFENAFVSKKNKKGGFRFPKDLKKLRVKHRLMGTSFDRKNEIIPFGLDKDKFLKNIKDYKNSFAGNFNDFDFIKIHEKSKEIVFQKGTHQLSKTLIIPKGYSVIVEKGFSLDFINGASIVSYSSFKCNGTEISPILFFSSNNSGSGIFISGPKEKSIVNYCSFVNLSNPSSEIWEVSGAVNFHETIVEINNSVFEKNRCEDALNIIRSKFTINSSVFESTFSDAFDGDFVEGEIKNCKFLNSGNDGIDISGSNINLVDITINNSSDKGVSAGESSNISGKNLKIFGGEIGIVSKDLSTISLEQVSILNTKLGLSSFQKKPEYGTGLIKIEKLILSNNELDYLIENGSQLLVDNVAVETVSNRVIDQMYGKEYGKSSK